MVKDVFPFQTSAWVKQLRAKSNTLPARYLLIGLLNTAVITACLRQTKKMVSGLRDPEGHSE